MNRRTVIIAGVAAGITLLAATMWYARRRDPPPPQPVEREGKLRTTADPRPHWRIAVVGTGFATDDEFRHTASVFEAQVVGKDPFFAAPENARRIEFVQIGNDTSITVRERDGARCYFEWDAVFGKAIGQIIKAQDLPGLTSILVLNNSDGLRACTAGELIIANRKAYKAAAHEFGHMIGGLFDEDTGTASRRKPVPGPNCASDISDLTKLPWDHSKFDEAPKEGCWFDKNLWRPADNCKMQTLKGEFCPACLQRLQEVFTTAVPQEQQTDTFTQFVVQVWRDDVFDVVSRKTYSGPVPPRVLRGPIVAGAVIENTVCLGGSYLSQLTTRAYRGLEEDPEIPISSTESIFAVVNCPGDVQQERLRRIEMMRVPLDRRLWVTPSFYMQNRNVDNIRLFNSR